jgi:Ca2+/Na+ antiporter
VSIPHILAVLIIVGVILVLVPIEETIRRWVVIITVILAVLCLLSLLFGGVFRAPAW